MYDLAFRLWAVGAAWVSCCTLRYTCILIPIMAMSASCVAVGQLVGTLFSHDSSRQVEQQHKQSQKEASESRKSKGTGEANGHAEVAARDMAVAARDASRVLQNLTSQVTLAACRFAPELAAV